MLLLGILPLDQITSLLKGGGCGVAAKPSHHTPLFIRTLGRYQISIKNGTSFTKFTSNVANANKA
jgi:hypothetical protein